MLKKILIVEDSELLHRMYDLMFLPRTRGGTRLLHAHHGQEGLAFLAQNPDVDLVILDINMPVMSGLEFLDHLKREREFRSIPVIIISTEGSEEDTVRGLKAGANAYLKKPFQAVHLLDMVDRVMASTSSTQPPAFPAFGLRSR